MAKLVYLSILVVQSYLTVDDHSLTNKMETLKHRRDTNSLRVSYGLFNGECFEDLFASEKMEENENVFFAGSIHH